MLCGAGGRARKEKRGTGTLDVLKNDAAKGEPCIRDRDNRNTEIRPNLLPRRGLWGTEDVTKKKNRYGGKTLARKENHGGSPGRSFAKGVSPNCAFYRKVGHFRKGLGKKKRAIRAPKKEGSTTPFSWKGSSCLTLYRHNTVRHSFARVDRHTWHRPGGEGRSVRGRRVMGQEADQIYPLRGKGRCADSWKDVKRNTKMSPEWNTGKQVKTKMFREKKGPVVQGRFSRFITDGKVLVKGRAVPEKKDGDEGGNGKGGGKPKTCSAFNWGDGGTGERRKSNV